MFEKFEAKVRADCHKKAIETEVCKRDLYEDNGRQTIVLTVFRST